MIEHEVQQKQAIWVERSGTAKCLLADARKGLVNHCNNRNYSLLVIDLKPLQQINLLN
jgi:hypothetical protein